MELINTKEKFLTTIKNNAEHLEHENAIDFEMKIAEAVDKLDFPELQESYEFSYLLKMNENRKFYPVIISHRLFWDEKLNCWNFDNEEILHELPEILE